MSVPFDIIQSLGDLETLNSLENGLKLKQEVTNVVLVHAEGDLSFSVLINVKLPCPDFLLYILLASLH